MTTNPSRNQVLLARLVVALIGASVALGIAVYGISSEEFQRLWRNLIDRPGGPMAFRFILQPIMSAIAAVQDGVADVRTGRGPYLWTMVINPEKIGGRLREGLIATARVILLGLGMDVIYQAIVVGTIHPVEAVIIAIVLAFVPYFLLRGPVWWIARWWGIEGPARDTR